MILIVSKKKIERTINGPGFVLKLEVLPDDHILSKHRSNPSEVETIAEEPVNW